MPALSLPFHSSNAKMSAALLNQDFGSESEGEEFNPAPADDSDNEVGSNASDDPPPKTNGRKSSKGLKDEDDEDRKTNGADDGDEDEGARDGAEGGEEEEEDDDEDEEDAISVCSIRCCARNC